MTQSKAKFFRAKSSGAIVFIHPCCVCGKPNAPFGCNVNLRGPAPRYAGDWFCDEKCKNKFEGEIKNYVPGEQLKLF